MTSRKESKDHEEGILEQMLRSLRLIEISFLCRRKNALTAFRQRGTMKYVIEEFPTGTARETGRSGTCPPSSALIF